MVSRLAPSLLRTGCLVILLISGGVVVNGQRTLPTDSVDSFNLGGQNAIEGSVLGPSGQRLVRRVKITLFTMTRGSVTSMTDEQGRFSFRGLASGDYTVTIDGEKEFEPVSQQVSILQLRGSPPQVYQLQIKMKFKDNGEPKAGVVDAQFANVPKPALELYTKATELARENDVKGAIEQLQLAVAEYPLFMLAYNEMGVLYLRLNDSEKADESFQSALKIEPAAFIPLMNRGALLVRLNKFSEAETVLRKALKADESSAVGHFYLAQAVANQNRFDEAEKIFLDSIKLGGDDMKESHRYLAIIYSSRGDTRRMVAELETYLKLVPLAADRDQLRGLIEKAKGAKP